MKRDIDETKEPCELMFDCHKITSLQSSGTNGFMAMISEPDREMYTLKQIDCLIAILMGGIMAEEVFCGGATNGAKSDIDQIKKLLGERHRSFLHFPAEDGLLCDEEDKVKVRNHRQLEKIKQDVVALLTEHRKTIEVVVSKLLTKDTLYKDELVGLFHKDL